MTNIINEIQHSPHLVISNWVNTNTSDSVSVLELGAGFFNKLSYVNHNVKKRIGIEIWEPYISNAQYHNCVKIHGDVLKYRELVSETDYDCVLMVDILEHFDKETAFGLIDMLKNDFNKILLMIPEGKHPQESDVTGYGAHEYQKHRSTWYVQDIESLGFDEVIHYVNFNDDINKDKGCIFAKWIKK